MEKIESIEYYDASQSEKIYFLTNFYRQKNIIPSNIVFSIPLEVLNNKALRKAFICLTERHEIFRTTLTMIDGNIKQRVWLNDPSLLKIKIIDIRKLKDKREIFFAFEKIKTDSKLVIFEYKKCPWLDVKLIKINNNINILLISIPHMICDEKSIEIIRKEFCQLYKSYLIGERVTLPKALQYKDYVVKVEEILKSKKGELDRSVWIKLLEEPPSINLTNNF